MADQYSVITNPVLNVNVSTNLSEFETINKFQKSLTVAALKGKLELVTGASPGAMHIEVFNKDNKCVCILDNDDALVGSYPIDDGMRIHVTDHSGKQKGEFADVNTVEKFEISEEEYAKRGDTVRAFKMRNKLGQYKELTPEEKAKKEEEEKKKKEEEEQRLASMKVGERCEVTVPNNPTRRGVVMYIGKTEFKPGTWVGVKYDEPFGKNDGSVEGKKYFECPAKYGAFVRPLQVKTGDYPEEEFNLDEDEM